MKAKEVIELRGRLHFQMTYREKDPPITFLRDIQHLGVQMLLNENLKVLTDSTQTIIDSLENIKDEKERENQLSETEVEIELKKMKVSDIPPNLKIDANGYRLFELFIEFEN